MKRLYNYTMGYQERVGFLPIGAPIQSGLDALKVRFEAYRQDRQCWACIDHNLERIEAFDADTVQGSLAEVINTGFDREADIFEAVLGSSHLYTEIARGHRSSLSVRDYLRNTRSLFHEWYKDWNRFFGLSTPEQVALRRLIITDMFRRRSLQALAEALGGLNIPEETDDYPPLRYLLYGVPHELNIPMTPELTVPVANHPEPFEASHEGTPFLSVFLTPRKRVESLLGSSVSAWYELFAKYRQQLPKELRSSLAPLEKIELFFWSETPESYGQLSISTFSKKDNDPKVMTAELSKKNPWVRRTRLSEFFKQYVLYTLIHEGKHFEDFEDIDCKPYNRLLVELTAITEEFEAWNLLGIGPDRGMEDIRTFLSVMNNPQQVKADGILTLPELGSHNSIYYALEQLTGRQRQQALEVLRKISLS